LLEGTSLVAEGRVGGVKKWGGERGGGEWGGLRQC